MQVVFVPIVRKNKPDEAAQVLDAVQDACNGLVAAGIRATVDNRDYVTPGAKYFEWERKVCCRCLSAHNGNTRD